MVRKTVSGRFTTGTTSTATTAKTTTAKTTPTTTTTRATKTTPAKTTTTAKTTTAPKVSTVSNSQVSTTSTSKIHYSGTPQRATTTAPTTTAPLTGYYQPTGGVQLTKEEIDVALGITPPPPEEIPEQIIEEPIEEVIEEPVIITLSAQTLQIINDIENGRILVPQWFLQDVSMVRNGTLAEQVFINMYNNLLETGEAHAPLNGIETTEISNITNAGMVLQSLDNFQISNGRLTGTINFKTSDTFNPYYYNKDLINYLQISTEAGKILRVKENRLRFGISNNLDLVETIHYDESTDDLTKVKVESFVWTADNFPMSGKLSLTVDEITGITEEAKSGFLGAGFTGAVAITILLGFLIGDKK